MKGDPIEPLDPKARALYEYLVSIGDQGQTDELPLSIVADTRVAPERGDPVRGAEVHRLACQGCHGEPGSGDGGFEDAPSLPDEAVDEAREGFPDFPPASVFVEKVRHGQFFNVGGNMPPFALEMLSDEDLGALLAFYEL